LVSGRCQRRAGGLITRQQQFVGKHIRRSGRPVPRHSHSGALDSDGRGIHNLRAGVARPVDTDCRSEVLPHRYEFR
jgi:hypothetical protein